MENKTTKKVATKKTEKSTVKATNPDSVIVLMTAEKEYTFDGDSLRVLFQLEPNKISGKTSISMTKNGLTYTKMMKPMLMKKFLNNATYLDILEKQIVTLLK